MVSATRFSLLTCKLRNVLKVAGEKGANIRDVTALVAASCIADCICQKIRKV